MVNKMRLIDANALIDTLEEWEENAIFGTENDGSDGTTKILLPVPTTTREMQDLVAMQPAVDAVPVVHGRWEPHPLYSGYDRCSACCNSIFKFDDDDKFQYCPRCGAEMDGGSHETD